MSTFQVARAAVAPMANLSVQTLECASLSEEQLRTIYEFCNSLMEESYNGFVNHVRQQDIIYVFRRKDKQDYGPIVGVSCWRTVPSVNPWIRIILQGKLRILKEYRRQGLHVQAELWYWLRQQVRHPLTTFYFQSIASLFNWVSMRKGVSHFMVMNDPPAHRTGKNQNDPHLTAKQRRLLDTVLYPVLENHVRDDDFEFGDDGSIYVKVFIRPETFAEYPPSFFDLPEAKEYIALNPRYREGHDLAYTYPLDVFNVISLTRRLISQRCNSRSPKPKEA